MYPIDGLDIELECPRCANSFAMTGVALTQQWYCSVVDKSIRRREKTRTEGIGKVECY